MSRAEDDEIARILAAAPDSHGTVYLSAVDARALVETLEAADRALKSASNTRVTALRRQIEDARTRIGVAWAKLGHRAGSL